MVIKKICNMIGTRKYDISGEDRKIEVIIGKPEIFPKGEGIDGFYYCPFQIKGLEDDRIMYSSGFDEIAAISSALRMLGAIIHCSKLNGENRIKWQGFTANDKLGLPEP